MDSLSCTGTENRVIDCFQNGIGNHNCDNSQDIALECVRYTPGSEGDARLVSGSGLTRGMTGRVEVYNNGQWITITESSTVAKDEADVICRQLGFPNSVYYGSVGDLG